jgi:hypothetical protein
VLTSGIRQNFISAARQAHLIELVSRYLSSSSMLKLSTPSPVPCDRLFSSISSSLDPPLSHLLFPHSFYSIQVLLLFCCASASPLAAVLRLTPGAAPTAQVSANVQIQIGTNKMDFQLDRNPAATLERVSWMEIRIRKWPYSHGQRQSPFSFPQFSAESGRNTRDRLGTNVAQNGT